MSDSFQPETASPLAGEGWGEGQSNGGKENECVRINFLPIFYKFLYDDQRHESEWFVRREEFRK